MEKSLKKKNTLSTGNIIIAIFVIITSNLVGLQHTAGHVISK